MALETMQLIKWRFACRLKALWRNIFGESAVYREDWFLIFASYVAEIIPFIQSM